MLPTVLYEILLAIFILIRSLAPEPSIETVEPAELAPTVSTHTSSEPERQVPLELTPPDHFLDEVVDAIGRHFPEMQEKAFRVVDCESTGIVNINTGNGYYGMWQFDIPTWNSVGGEGLPSVASADEQTMRARMLYDSRGWQPWPQCGKL